MADDVTTPETKPAWQSKTVWINILLAVVPFIPGAAPYVQNPEIMGALFAVVNIVLRLVSKGSVSIA